MHKTKILGGSIAVLLVAGGAYFLLRKPATVNEPIIPVSDTVDSASATTKTESVTVSTKPVTSSGSGGLKGAGVTPDPLAEPVFDKPVKILTILTPAVEADARENIAKLVSFLQKDSSDHASWIALGIYRKILGDYKEAETLWLYVTHRWPTDFIAYNNLGNLYLENLKDSPKAEQYFLKTAELKPLFTQTYLNLYNLYRYAYKGKEAEAPKALLAGLAKNPKDSNLMVALARHYVDMGDTVSAKTYYTMAIQRAEADKKTTQAESLRKEAGESHISL